MLKSRNILFISLCLLSLSQGLVNKVFCQSLGITFSSAPIFNIGKIKSETSQPYKSHSKQNVTYYKLSGGLTYTTKKNYIFRIQLLKNISNDTLYDNKYQNSGGGSIISDKYLTKSKGIELSYGKKKSISKFSIFTGIYIGYLDEKVTVATVNQMRKNYKLTLTQKQFRDVPMLHTFYTGIFIDAYYNFSKNIAVGISYNPWFGYKYRNGKMLQKYSEIVDNIITYEDFGTTQVNDNFWNAELINFRCSIQYTINFKKPKVTKPIQDEYTK